MVKLCVVSGEFQEIFKPTPRWSLEIPSAGGGGGGECWQADGWLCSETNFQSVGRVDTENLSVGVCIFSNNTPP